jgi:hypothetical protein
LRQAFTGSDFELNRVKKGAKAMKKSGFILFLTIIFISSQLLTGGKAWASDSCMFMSTVDDLPPNIVFLLDNSVEMQHTIEHPDYNPRVDYTPAGPQADTVVHGIATGTGFYNAYGYQVVSSGGNISLAEVGSDLEVAKLAPELQETGSKGSGTWTINGRTITLPIEADNLVDADGIIDNAGFFKYSANYLNWLFYYSMAVDLDGDGTVEPTYNGAALESRSRFYYAKKALLNVGRLTSNKAKFSIYNFTSDAGSSQVQPLKDVVATLGNIPQNNVLDSAYINNINNMGTTTYAPLAEGLAKIGADIGSPSFDKVDMTNWCGRTFVIIVTPGLTSMDKTGSHLYNPDTLSDLDGDTGDGEGNSGPGQGQLTLDGAIETINTGYNGSTYLDDVAHYLYTNDMKVANDDVDGWQNVLTYTVGFMANQEARLFLINTSNNGNGLLNLTDSTHPEYGKYHFDAASAKDLSDTILETINSILSRPNTFTAPVVPVTRTTSGDKIYMAFFTPLAGNFWKGNVTKFYIGPQSQIIGADGNLATWPNGSLKDSAVAIWDTKHWADTSKSNGIHNSSRNIYTYFGTDPYLYSSVNEFSTSNTANLTAAVLGDPADVTVNATVVTGREKVINYYRGADVFDEDDDNDTSENRYFITGDILHSEPLVVRYNFPNDTAKTMVFFGSNDGMLHAVLDQADPDVNVIGDETDHGTEAWAFIPAHQLPRLTEALDNNTHLDFVDSSPKVYFHDVDADGLIDTVDGDMVILICGERRGGTSYFALDVTDPLAPQHLWGLTGTSRTGTLTLDSITRFNLGTFNDGDTLRLWNGYDRNWYDVAVVSSNESGSVTITYDAATHDLAVGNFVGNITNDQYDEYEAKPGGPHSFTAVWGRIASITYADPYPILSELGESWSEPKFGIVKTSVADTTGTPVFFIGGGYSSDNSDGKVVVAVNVLTGTVVKKFTGINFSVPSSVKIIDENNNGFVDKIYVGDLGGQIWRIGKFDFDPIGNPMTFPASDEDINNWTSQVLFRAPTYALNSVTYTRKFFYPPSVTFEKGYDMVFAGTGDREDACSTTTDADRIYAIKDTHASTTLTELNLVDVTDPTSTPPDLSIDNGDVDLNNVDDQGWYIRLVDAFGLAVGEKVLAEGIVFYKALYITTFLPTTNPCVPGGEGHIYALDHLTGGAVLTFGNDTDGDGVEDLTRNHWIGGGIPSKPVIVLTPLGQKLLISMGVTRPEANSESTGAGIIDINPLMPPRNFFYLWWRQLFS